MEPIFWKKLPCLKEQRWEKWLERLVWSVKSRTPQLALLTCLNLCKGYHHPLGLASWKPGHPPSPTCSAETVPWPLPSPHHSHLCFSPLPLPAGIISPLDYCTASINKFQPSLALPSALQGLPERSLQKINLIVLPSLWPPFPLKMYIKRNRSLAGPTPSGSTSPLLSGSQSHWWLFSFVIYLSGCARS